MNLIELAQSQDGLITVAQARELGMRPSAIKRRVRRGEWQSVSRGVYYSGCVEPPMPTLIRAGFLTGGPSAVVVRRSAALLHGFAGVRSDLPQIHISLPGDRAIARRLGDAVLVPHQIVLDDADVVDLDGMRVTNAVRTLADLLLTAHRFEAVSAMDSALNKGLITEVDLPAILQLMAGRRGVVEARQWMTQVDGRAESPLETRVRLRCLDGGVPPDDLQVEILGGAIRGDMIWSRHRLIGEADGAQAHDTVDALFRDRERQNALVALGFRIVRFTWEDTISPETIPMMVRRAMAAR